MARRNVIQFSIEIIDKVSTKLRAISAKFGAFAKKTALAAAGLATAFAFAGKKALDAADAIGVTAKVVGVTAESLQKLRFAAEQAGISNIGLDDSLRRMQRRMGEFVNSGAGPAKLAIEGLDIAITDAAGQFVGTEDAFFRVVEAMGQLGSTAEKSAVAAQLFGDDFGPKLVTLIDEGEDAIRAYGKELEGMGALMSNETVAAAEKANEVLGKLGTLLQTKMIKAFADNADTIESVATALLNVTIQAFNALDAFAKWVGLVDKTMPDLVTQLHELVAERDALIVPHAEFANFLQIRELNAEIAETILKIQALSQVVKKVPPIPVGTDIVGGGFGAVDTTLESFISGFDSVEARAQQMREKLRDAILKGIEIPPENVVAFNAAIAEMFNIDEIKVTAKKKAVTELFDPMVAAAEQAAGNIQDAFAEFFFDPFEKGIKGMLKSFVDAIRKMIANVLALQTVKALGITSGLSSLFGERASGGPVTGGQPYIVGERGPELFVPGASGSIVPNSALGSAGGGLQFVTNISANGADPGLIARLPEIMEQRDRQLMLKVKDFFETGSIAI